MTLGSTLSGIWNRLQGEFFPVPAREVGPLLGAHKRFVKVLDLVKLECFVGEVRYGPWRTTGRWPVPSSPRFIWDLPPSTMLKSPPAAATSSPPPMFMTSMPPSPIAVSSSPVPTWGVTVTVCQRETECCSDRGFRR